MRRFVKPDCHGGGKKIKFNGMIEKTDEIILKVADLIVAFGDNLIIDNLNFEVKKGEVMAIVGPNGAGKTVLFRTLLGLLPYKGTISWKTGVKIGYVPQKLFVEKSFPLSVLEFFKFKSRSLERILFALSAVGIKGENHHDRDHVLHQRLGALSGGELQRILIAWSLLDNPEVLLFDEPTSGIDIGGEETIYNLLHALQEKNSLTIVLISHDLNIVYKYANTVLCLNREQLCFGEPSVVLDPNALSSLYGGETSFYRHEHERNHNR